LGKFLPETDVAQFEFSRAAADGSEDVSEQIKAYYKRATPMLDSKDGKEQSAYLLAPASDAGRKLAEHATTAVPELEIVRVPGQADLMLCREQHALTAEDMKRLFRICRQAYEERAVAPTTSPHARFDFADWLPFDP
jgi:hypothetical protein